MNLIPTPIKPFHSYKWRWATFQPTESLNSPPIFLGVLRVFNQFDNYSPSSREVLEGLAIVKQETGSNVDLVRTPERNLIRNSGQYWKALGLLNEAHGRISISAFGKLLAEGEITQAEFATTVVKTLELPNKRIGNDETSWESVGLKIKPLELILNILTELNYRFGVENAYITPFELLRVVIPLAGSKALLSTYADALSQYRKGLLDISTWPDCAPSANDKRMAREFLLFLSNYGFCKVTHSTQSNSTERYSLADIVKEEIIELNKVAFIEQTLDKFVKVIRETHIPSSVDRKRVTREVLERPFQNLFRKNILVAFNSTCILTGTNIEGVLEAAHIVDVKYKGTDKIDNGLCMRSDIHQLFDARHLKLFPDGKVHLSELAAKKENYGFLPNKIEIPNFINKEYLSWRLNYT